MRNNRRPVLDLELRKHSVKTCDMCITYMQNADLIPRKKSSHTKEKSSQEDKPTPRLKDVTKPNLRERSIPGCYATTGRPCQCRRVGGACIKCRREVVVTHGEMAEPLSYDKKHRLVNYVCLRCR